MRRTASIIITVALATGCGGGGGGGAGAAIAPASSATTATPSSATVAPPSSAAITVSAAPPTAATALSLTLGAKTSAAQSVQPGASRVAVLQVHIANAATAPQAVLQGLVVRAAGTSVPSRDIASVELALDRTSAGAYVAGSSILLGSATFSSAGAATFDPGRMTQVAFPSGLGADFLVLFTFSPNAVAGATISASVDSKDLVVIDPATKAPLASTGAVAGATVTIGAATATPGTPGAWIARTSMPTPRMKMAAAATDTKIFVIGGRIVAGSLPTNEAYDIATDSWSTKADMPTPRVLHGAACLNGKIYVCGGSPDGVQALATVEVYDVATDSWAAAAPLPRPRRDLAVVAYQNKIWAIGGTDGTSNYMGTDVLDPATGLWSTGPQIGVVTGWPAAVAGNFITVFGGTQVNWGPGAAGSTTPAPGMFAATSGGSFSFPGGSSASGIGTKAYVAGGLASTGAVVATLESVDAATLSQGQMQKLASMAHARRNLAVVAANGKVYAFGGYDGGSAALDYVEQYTP